MCACDHPPLTQHNTPVGDALKRGVSHVLRKCPPKRLKVRRDLYPSTVRVAEGRLELKVSAGEGALGARGHRSERSGCVLKMCFHTVQINNEARRPRACSNRVKLGRKKRENLVPIQENSNALWGISQITLHASSGDHITLRPANQA